MDGTGPVYDEAETKEEHEDKRDEDKRDEEEEEADDDDDGGKHTLSPKSCPCSSWFLAMILNDLLLVLLPALLVFPAAAAGTGTGTGTGAMAALRFEVDWSDDCNSESCLKP